MSSVLELVDEKETVAWAAARGILSLKLNLKGNVGWPDRLFGYLGRSVFIEFKRRGADLARNQPERVYQLVRAGFTVGVYDDSSAAAHFLDATLLSKDWRQAHDRTGVCRLVLQARPREDDGCLYGRPLTTRDEIYPPGTRHFTSQADVHGLGKTAPGVR